MHSLTDVPVYSWGKGAEYFAKPGMNNVDIAFQIARALNLGRSQNVTASQN